jgi:hypothetical protein
MASLSCSKRRCALSLENGEAEDTLRVGIPAASLTVSVPATVTSEPSWSNSPVSLCMRSGRSVVPPKKRRLGSKAGYVHLMHLLSDGFASTIVVG